MIPIRPKNGSPAPRRSQQAVKEAPANRTVPEPVPVAQLDDPRGFQIAQVKRRFSPNFTETTLPNNDTLLLFDLKPSDPDFPFDLPKLQLELRVPAGYPAAPPKLSVKDSQIPKGFAINIERGFDKLVQQRPGCFLRKLVNELDKALASILSEKKAETVKLTFVKHARDPDDEEPTVSLTAPAPAPAPAPKPVAESQPKPYIPRESFSQDQINEAKARRAQETRQLEARMGRLPSYQKSSDGVIYTLPLEPKRRAQLPIGLQAVQSMQLIVPLLYPLQPLRVLLNDVDSEDAEGLEDLFSEKTTQQKQMTLTSHVNYLAQTMHILAKEAQGAATKADPVEEPSASSRLDLEAKEAEHSSTLDSDKPHLRVVPRPPEWSFQDDSDASYSDDDYSDGEEYEDGGAAFAGQPSLTSQPAERGTALSFPHLELHGLELLQISILNLVVKCSRCKTPNEITGLQGPEKTVSCKKCATSLAVTFRPELMHANSNRAGFLDTSACTVSDLLPSTFLPTCAGCSTTPSQGGGGGLVSVRGETVTNICRECHARFTFALPEVRFQTYSTGAAPPPSANPRVRQEKLGLRAGEPLPARGACGHYRRSNRWFRFSCCAKVYPCDRCHDAAEEHVNEWANRMICGWCSREQRYRVESCGFCGRSVIGKRGTGFWEGGKGTRDRVLMRRGDKRKYRRIGGAAPKKEE